MEPWKTANRGSINSETFRRRNSGRAQTQTGFKELLTKLLNGVSKMSELDAAQQQKKNRCIEFMRRAFSEDGSSYSGWVTTSSTQIASVLLNFPYTFAQLGMSSGILCQITYGLMGCWSAYLMSSLYLTYYEQKRRLNGSSPNYTAQWYEVLEELLGVRWKYAGLLSTVPMLFVSTMQVTSAASTVYILNDQLSKRAWTIAFSPILLMTMLVPTARNYRVLATLGIVFTTYTGWYLTVAALLHGREPGSNHNAPTDVVSYFTGSSTILFTFGGHTLTIEFAAAMWEPKRYKLVYLYAVLYLFTFTVPSAVAVYWAFGDKMLHNANAMAVFPKTKFRDAAIVLMILHSFLQMSMLLLPLFYMLEKLFGIHHSGRYMTRILVRLPLCIAVWLTAIAVPFIGLVSSALGASFSSFCGFIIPCLAHMVFHMDPAARKSAIEKPPKWLRGWASVYSINLGIILWVSTVGMGIGGWATIASLSKQVHTFGLFAKCYQCPIKH